MGKLAPKDIENILSLTPLQEGMLFHYLQNPQSPFYFEQLSLEISGVIDHKLFEEAWNVVIKTNEMLRVVFRWDKVDNPVQIVLKEHEFQPRYIDIPGTDTGERKERLEQIKQKDAQEKFDLQEVPFRVTLCKIEKDKYVMILSNHHILYDGWSNGIILKEFFKVYHKLRHGKGSRKVPIKPSFNEFIKWSQNQDKNKQQQFWREYLAGIETPTVLPIKRKIEETVRAADYSIILEENIRFKLDFFTKEYRVTLASVFYTTWGILLRKYCGSEDVIFGATVSGRTAEIKGIEEMVGLFINTIPLRTQTIPREKICDVVFRTDQALREREEFENTPLVDIQGYSPLGSGGALFDIIVAIENYPLDNRLAPDGQGADSSLSVHSYSMAEMTHYDLTVGIMLFNEIEIKFSFKPGLFEEEIIENLAGHFKGIIRTMIENPGMELSQLEIISGDEKNRILYEFTNTKVEYPANKTIHQLFEEQVEQSPDRIAIFGRGRTLSWTNTDIIVGAGSQTCPMVLSYRQLNEQSNRLAGLLVEKGVLADNIVGIMMERSVEMIVGIIGILKSGGAYLPIDPGYPQERIDFMLKDSAAKILLTAAECVFNFHHSSFIIHHSSHSSHLAYIIYTSGTTGKPKGVIVEHGSIFNTIYWRRQEYNLSAADRSLQLFSFAFDGFLTSFFTPVVSGTPVVLLSDDEAKDITRIKEIIISEKITHFICVPSLYRWLLGASTGKELSRLKVVTLAGEQVTPDLVEKSKQLNPLLEIVNEYGPTESSVLASINRDIQPGATISIGKPIANSGIYIIDKDEKLSPIGIPGQLVIFGKGLARGYLNNPELTSQKFNRSYRSYKTYINYKTGDIARFLSDGKIEFLGRIDQQVKIRGFRIEPGEIETLLLKHDRIKDAAIVVKGDETGDQNLAAYFVSDAALSDSELREYLLKDMPEYMIPSYFVRLEKIPLTSSGKLDRGALPNPKVKEIAAYTAPRNVIEMKLVDIWAGIFDRNISPDRISIDDNFFRLGGHSLKATILVSKIHKVFDVKVPLTEIFKNPTIRGLSRYIENAVGDRYIRTAPVEKKEYYVLSSAQKRLFFLQQMELDSTGYNITSVMTLEGELDKEKFEKTFNKLIARHESLRTSFEFIDKEPVQRIHDHVEFEIEYKNSSTDYTDYTDGRGDATLPLWSPFIRPFDLSKAPLLRVGLARLEEKRHLWMVDMHHIICDGTSMGILVKDFMALYEGKELPSLKIHYKDYAEWQSNDKNREFLDSQEKFWLGQYADEIPVLNLPADFPRPLVQSFEGNHEPFELTMEETSSLKTLAMEQGITLYMLLLAICNTWFSKLSGEEDVVIGTPVAGRRHDEHQDIVGMFVNTLALRNYPAAAITFTDFLMEIKERTVEAFQNQDYPFETLVDQVVKDRDTSRNPLFDVMFVFQNMDVPEIEIPGLILKPYEFENKTSKFDLNLDGMEKDGKLLFNLEYSTKLFKKETALRFNNYFKNIINSIIRRPGMRIADIEIMGKEEKERILEISNGVEEYVDLNETVHGMFEKVAAGNEDKTALVFGKGRITYGELNRVANRLARILRTQGVGSDNNVGLMVERSFELVIGMLAIMKAGGAYLPIDPKFPPQRKRFMMEDSHMTTLLTNYEINGAADYIPGSIGIVDMRDNSIYRDIAGGAEEELQNTNKGSDLVYVIFTSGSTGKPKGVMLEHTNLVNLIKFHHKYTGIDCTKVLQFATISFDASFHEIFSCLLAGGELYLVDEGTKNNIPLLFEFIAKNKIRTLFMPMAILRLIFSHDEYINTFPASVTHIQTAGEQVIVDDKFRNHLKEAKIYLHNHYGPSETHVVTVLTMTPQGYIPEFPSIGTPVMNTGIYILDKEKHLLPMGVVGELYAGGLQVGRGYLNNPELTVEKFDQDLWDYRDDRDEKNKSFAGDQGPAARGAYKELFQKHPLVYNTGDLARWLPNGDVEFLGRIDHQVKIRGIRVEPGEIENHLKKIEFVKDAIVMVKQEANREKYLCAYIVLHPGIELDISKLRNSLAEELPDYMIPAYFVPLDKIPLTPIGKLDRHSLPEPEIIKEEKTYVAPRNSIEEALVEIWSEALGIGKQTISIRDNFFYLGGHSLKAALLAARIHRKFNVNIPLLEIFRAPVLKDLAQYIEKKADPYKYISIESAEKREYYVLSSAQKRLYVIQQMDPDSTVYNIPAVMTLIGELDSVKFEGIFKKLIHRHESLRTSFHMLNEEPVQRIHDEVKFEIEYFDLATKDAKRHEENQIHHSSFIIHHYIQSFVRPFDLSKAPLLRVGLVKLEEEEHILLVDMNHIISDGISIGIMVNEFMTLIAGEDPEPLRIQYRDWAQWQDHEKNSERVKKQEAYWLKEFEGKIPVLNLPYDYTSPTVQDFVGKRVNFALSNNETESLNKLARQEEVTLYMLLISAYYTLLYKLTDREDIIIGAPTAGRFQEELQKIIGMFLNTLALRNFPGGNKPFKLFLKDVKTKVLNAFENQDYQFDDLVDRLELKRGDGRNPLFDVMFILQNLEKPEIHIPGLAIKNVELENPTTKFDLSLYAEEIGHDLSFGITFREKLFTQATIALIIDYFKVILSSVIKNPGQPLAEINIISEERRTAMLSQLNQDLQHEAAPIMEDCIFQTRLQQSLLKYQDNIALEYGGSSLSYAELDRRSDVVCRWILNKGIAGHTFIGMLINHRLQLIITLLGIIKSGCVIVPLYPGYPTERLEEMIQVTGLRYMFIDQDNARRFKQNPDVEFIDPACFDFDAEGEKGIEDNKRMALYNPEDPLYIHFTSGSTGEPKATLGKNRGLLHFISWEITTLGITPGFHAAQFTIPGFDPFLRDVFAPLLAGGVVCIPANEDIVRHAAQLAYYVEQRRINLIHCVTGLFRLMISSAPPPTYFRNLKYILLAGEKTNPSDLVEWYDTFGERVQLLNCYGPTETTMSKAYYPITPADIKRERIPVGKPLPGARIIILDENRNMCAPLTPGEICIRTPFGSCGYFNAPGLNREKFIVNPFGNDHGDLIYRSGDLGRILADGNLDILGRTDRQIKIRGYRVEPGDIEHHLLKHPEIKDALVLPLGDDSKDSYLCAYIIPRRPFTVSELREYLAQKLPDYMIPAYFVTMERFPLTARGKIDRNSLPEPGIEVEENIIAPANETEKKLLKIWAEVLRKDESKISVEANFIDLGGHSLKAATLAAKIHKEFNVNVPLADFFKALTIRGLSQYIKGTAKEQHLEIEPVEKKWFYPLSSAQKRLYFLQVMEGNGITYNMPRMMKLEGKIDPERLTHVFNRLIQRHESLRTSFHMVDEEPVQRVLGVRGQESGDSEEKNLTKVFGPTFFQKGGLSKDFIKEFIRPFDLSKAPLLRLGLVKLAEEEHLLLVDMHHIISDGVSIDVLVQDFSSLYSGKELPEMKLQYKDYAEWQNRERGSKKILAQGEYWKKEYEGEIPVLELPTDYARPDVQAFDGERVNFEVSSETSGILKAMALETGATLYIVLLALYSIFLAKLSSREDIVIGSPVAGRRHSDLEKIIGMFVNTLALRVYPAGEKNFSYFLQEVKEKTLKDLENQEYQYEDLVEEVAVTRDLSRNPLFDTMFALQNTGTQKFDIPGLTLLPCEYENKTAKFDLILNGLETEGKLLFTLDYCTKLFKRETIERFITYFINIIHGAVENKHRRISDFEIITAEEKERLLYDFNNTYVEYPKDKTIHRLFEEQVEQNPDRIALVGATAVETLRATSLQISPTYLQITYRQLNEQSDRLAGVLIEKGVLPDTIVGLMMERSVEMIIGILGILKSCGAYLPIDPDYPQERIDYMLKDSGAKLLVNEKFFGGPGGDFSKKPPARRGHFRYSNHLAYIIYTSGSTGRPKGVLVQHRSAVNLICNQDNFFKINKSDRILQFSTICFDASVEQIFTALSSGAVLVLIDKSTLLDVDKFEKFVFRHQVTHIHAVPSFLNGIHLRHAPQLKRVVSGGDICPISLAEKWGRNCDFYNKYGPTETTVTSIEKLIKDTNTFASRLSIGKPIGNTIIYLLDRFRKPVPLGVIGELYIGGEGIARGYMNRPELTAERFILTRGAFEKAPLAPPKLLIINHSPFTTHHSPLYKTGDLARWLSNGNIDFLGRIDNQVKIRGFRVELGEIENRILKHTGIKEAAAVIKEEESGDRYICAYVVSDREYDAAGLRQFLLKELPDHMIPSYFVQIEKMPLTANGKIDRKVLPKPELKAGDNFTAPRNGIERKLAALWSEILGKGTADASQLQTSIGIDDNFFQVGGHSLKATILAAKMHKAFDVKVPLAEIFKRPTIRGLADYINFAAGEKYIRIEPVEKKEYYPLSSAQKRLYFLQVMEETGTAYNLSQVLKLEGKIDVERLKETFVKLIRRHESARTSFHMIDDEPVQRIHDNVEFEIEYFDLAAKDAKRHEENKIHHSSFMNIPNHFIRSFDLSKAPLLRVELVKLEEEKYVLLVDMHHIISDGTSMAVLVKEFMTLYDGRELPQLRLHYKDYAVWEKQRQEEIRKQQDYWLKEFGEFQDEIPVLDLPVDYLRPKVNNFAGSVLNFELDGKLTRALNDLALQHGVTLYMALLAIYNIFLAKISGQEIIVVGTPTAGRHHADLEQVIGMFVNTLALKNAPALEKRFRTFLEEVKENTINAFANQDYPYDKLVEKVVHNRDAGHNPLFDTMFILQNMDSPTMEIPGLKLGPFPYERDTAKFDLTLVCDESDDCISCTLEYSTQLFRRETIQRFANYLENITTAAAWDSEQLLAKINMLTDEEKKQLIMDFNDTAVPYPDNKTIYQLFEEQVDQFPDHPALVFENHCLTFRHFDERANQLAKYLRHEKQVQVGDRIVVLMDRSIELIIVLMGVMKARCAYVPMDVSLPAERLRIVFNDASIEVVASQQKYLPMIAGVQAECRGLRSILCMDVLQKAINGYPASRPTGGDIGDVDDAAYVMYTSGSSGIPKGVLVKHRTIVNTIIWRKNNYEYAAGHVSLQVPPYFFDSSVTDIFTPLLGGARLVLIRDEERTDLAALRRIIVSQGVSHFIVVPIFYNIMLEEIAADLKYIKMICCAGDNFSDELIRKHFERLPHVRIFNEYGPTENSVNSTAYELKSHSTRALIGRPCNNIAVYILDRYQCLTPIGVTGELCLAGSSLAVGYLNRPELTNESFINRSFAGVKGGLFQKPPLIFYKTGDQARWLSEGNLEFMGRIDRQVKIRGMRIETGEIENQLMKHGDIKEAVVLVKRDESGTNYLCAYIAPHSQGEFSAGPAGLKDYLSQWLPAYMIPSYFLLLDKLPLTLNNKLDINALPEPRLEPVEAYTGPRNEIEKKMVEIWEAVLGKNNIGIDDNFFYIGGDSIKSIQIMSRMNRAGYKLEMKDIFQYPLISELAPHVKKVQRIPDQSPVMGMIPLTPIQAAFFNDSLIDAHYYNQAVMFYAPTGFDLEVIKKVFIKIQEHHDALRMTYKIEGETGEVLQVNHGLDFPLSLREYDLKGRGNGLEELTEKINAIQGSIDLEKGPLMKLGLFHPEDGDRLLIVIHHLVIDGISWRILLEDIATLFEQILAGQEMVLPPKTDSFKYWSEKLQDYAYHKTLLKEKPYWDQLESEIVPPIKKDFPIVENLVKDTGKIQVKLAEAETALLLNKVNQSYKTEIDDILLTALALAIRKTFGHERILISLEGHGRESIGQEIDISRTVGWFAAEYPVVMDVSYADDNDPGRQIKEIKETLRKIPNKGIGYGVLKYLNRDASGSSDGAAAYKLKPQIIFNYLGQFDADVAQTSLFQVAKEPPGNSQSLNFRREYELEINGMTANNLLSMTFSYNQTQFKQETIAALAGNFLSELKHIIAFCSAKEYSERTPSDFTYKELTIERLQQLLDVYHDVEDIYPLSPMQEGMLFHALVDPSSHSYFQQTAFRLQGELDIPLVEKSLNELVNRHDVLRTAFVHKDTKRPVQVVLRNRPVDFYYRDISYISDGDEKEVFVREFKTKDKKRSFDLTNDVLVRASILRLDKSTYEFLWSFHHILMDGWCIGILNSEFFQVYTGYVQARPYRLPGIKPYRSYIRWLEKQDQEESGQYWQNYLEYFSEQTAILPPKTIKDTDQAGYSNRKISFELSGDHTKMLNKLSARYNVTLNTLTQTIWGILLGKYTGKEDVVFGSVVSGRPFELEGVESMVGLFINTIPVRIRYHEKMKFHNLLQKIQAVAIAGEAYHYHPLAEIQSLTPLKQDLMDHLFIFENYPIAEQIEGFGHEMTKGAESSLTFKLADVHVFEQTNYDLNVILSGSERLKAAFQYNGHAVDDDYIKQIARHFRAAFDQVIEDRELEVGDLTFLSEEEKNRILYDFNNTATAYPAEKTIHQLFEEQVEQNPDRIAIVGAGWAGLRTCPYLLSLSYRQLNEQSDRLAGVLMGKGVLADNIIGIMIQRSVEMITGIMGILKSGSAYLPIDPELPRERIQYMLEDSNVKILVGMEECQKEIIVNCQLLIVNCKLKNMRSLQAPLHYSSFILNGRPRRGLHHSNCLAYTIYTSGSTGKPKGVAIPHRNVVNFIKGMVDRVDFSPHKIVLAVTTLSFDIFVLETLLPLTRGLRIVIADEIRQKDPRALWELIAKNAINLVQLTPSRLKLLLSHSDISYLNKIEDILVGGEAFPRDLFEELKEKYQGNIINVYGPTETTVWSTTRDLTGRVEITIGKPIANTQVYIFDKFNRMLPVGIPGELYIGGDGIARGYLNSPELTAEKFRPQITLINQVKNKKINKSFAGVQGPAARGAYKELFQKHPLVYRTGDLARWLDDANIEFLGRIDQQVKIRGFRIELGEIENRLKEHPLIKEAVVIDRNDREKQYLCAYITLRKASDQSAEKAMVPVQQLKEHLESKLPAYMVPACFVEIDKIPLNTNGKIDRGMLPRPMDSDFHGSDAYQAPVTDLQRMIANIWEEVLGREKIGIQDNFFEMGGDSLDFVKVANKLREKLNMDIPVATLFTYTTISSLERYLSGAQLPAVSTTAPDNFIKLNGSPQSVGNIFFVHEVLGDVGAYMEFCKQLGNRFNCWGVAAEKLKNYIPKNVTIEEISARYIHQMKLIQPHGPYNIATWSWGGHLGVEMALQLEKMGEKITFLGFIDCSGPDCRTDVNVEDFTLESEKIFLRPFAKAAGRPGEFDNIHDMDQLWTTAMTLLTATPAMVEHLRQLLILNALALPDYHNLSGEDLVQFFNLNRTHAHATSKYTPAGKIHTPIHFFWANQNPGMVETWKDYCHHPVIYHEINGDHHSIFRNIDQIVEFAGLFREVISRANN